MKSVVDNDLWGKTLNAIKKNIGVGAFNSWISKIKFISVDNSTLKLSVNSNFIKDAIITKYYEEILQNVQRYIPTISSIDITVCDNNLTASDLDVPGSLFAKTWKNKNAECQNSPVTLKELNKNSALDKKFTFENFVVGQPNEFAYAVAKNIATSDNSGFNPLFLYGGVGMGKTHLVQAIAWHKRNTQPSKTVIYVSAERFMYLFLKSLHLKSNINFKELFNNVDVLIIDDVQFIGGKNSTQEEFLYTFNKFIDSERQIILVANKAPSDLPGIDTTLKSRLSGGLVVDVHQTTYELRLEILKSSAKKFKIPVPQSVVEKLADSITSNIRELEGALNRLIAHAILVNRKIDTEMAKDVLSDVIVSNDHLVTLQSIQKCVCNAFAITRNELLSNTRIRTIAVARQVAMYLSKDLTGYSYAEIGKVFGNRDHSTVVHAVKNVRNKMSTDINFSNSIKDLRASL